jgi:V8-like Glu-specific endopeptidase
MKMKIIGISTVFFMIGLITLMNLSASIAITNGVEDVDDDYPWVVLVLMEIDGVPTYRCSGTIIAPTVVLTAGHCVNNYPDSFSGIRIFTEQDVDNGNNDYPFAGPNAIEASEWYSLPGYETLWYAYDAGVIILSEPVYFDTYPTLPELDSIDKLATERGLQDVTFTAVGYGLQEINPVFVQGDRVRMIAHPMLVALNAPGMTGDFSLLLSNNYATGGTCFGDSGGPNFLGDSLTIGGVTSFGLNGNCAGIGGVFRMDRQNVLDFVNQYLD